MMAECPLLTQSGNSRRQCEPFNLFDCSGPRRLYLLRQSRLVQSIKEMLVVPRVLERDKPAKRGNGISGLVAQSLGCLCPGLLKMTGLRKGRGKQGATPVAWHLGYIVA